MAHPLFQAQERHYPASDLFLENPTSSDTLESPASDLAPQDPEEKPRKKRPSVTIALVLALVIVAIIVANLAIMAMATTSGDPAPRVPARAQEQAPPAPAAPRVLPPGLLTTFGEGRYLVGIDIAPGTYQTTGPSGSLDCYWERLKDTHGAADSIIANNLGLGPATVTIKEGDAAFQTRWCNTWSKVG